MKKNKRIRKIAFTHLCPRGQSNITQGFAVLFNTKVVWIQVQEKFRHVEKFWYELLHITCIRQAIIVSVLYALEESVSMVELAALKSQEAYESGFKLTKLLIPRNLLKFLSNREDGNLECT